MQYIWQTYQDSFILKNKGCFFFVLCEFGGWVSLSDWSLVVFLGKNSKSRMNNKPIQMLKLWNSIIVYIHIYNVYTNICYRKIHIYFTGIILHRYKICSSLLYPTSKILKASPTQTGFFHGKERVFTTHNYIGRHWRRLMTFSQLVKGLKLKKGEIDPVLHAQKNNLS